jgi:hypothetical protein
VAVNSNTSHEIENIEKCLAGGFDFVVSISPNENTLKNIERAARKSLDESNLLKVQFLLPNQVADWLSGLAKMDEPTLAPAAANTKKIGGRTVRVQRVEMSPSERKAMSEQQIEAIAAIVNRNKSDCE